MAGNHVAHVAWREGVEKVSLRLEQVETGDIEELRLQAEFVESYQDFSGSTARNYFHASETLKLTGLYFEGHYTCVADPTDQTYTVEVDVEQGVYPKDATAVIYSASTICKSTAYGYIYVPFREPVYIQRKMFYTVVFRLLGPATRLMLKPEGEVTVTISGFGDVTLQFLKGSRQMSGIEFTLIPEDEIPAADLQWKRDAACVAANRVGWFGIWFEWIASFFI